MALIKQVIHGWEIELYMHYIFNVVEGALGASRVSDGRLAPRAPRRATNKKLKIIKNKKVA